jgi:hypothetical protein
MLTSMDQEVALEKLQELVQIRNRIENVPAFFRCVGVVVVVVQCSCVCDVVSVYVVVLLCSTATAWSLSHLAGT